MALLQRTLGATRRGSVRHMAPSDPDDTSQAVVRALLSAHGLHVSDRETAALARLYPAIRRRMERLYAVDCGDGGVA